ncbi:hypothetical protein J6590_005229 [Homalodisca vitripennis]|nr:hypothetical protein J6590_005229 [Homalodisca vitripennis]
MSDEMKAATADRRQTTNPFLSRNKGAGNSPLNCLRARVYSPLHMLLCRHFLPGWVSFRRIKCIEYWRPATPFPESAFNINKFMGVPFCNIGNRMDTVSNVTKAHSHQLADINPNKRTPTDRINNVIEKE